MTRSNPSLAVRLWSMSHRFPRAPFDEFRLRDSALQVVRNLIGGDPFGFAQGRFWRVIFIRLGADTLKFNAAHCLSASEALLRVENF